MSRSPRLPVSADRPAVWWDLPRRPEFPERPSLETIAARTPALARTEQTVIVGGGVAGLSLALELARRGEGVLLLERHALACGATGRNAGFLLADSECTSLAAAMHGRPAALDLRAAGLATRAFVRRIERSAAAAGLPFGRGGMIHCGSLRLAADRGEADHFAATEKLLRVPAVRAVAADALSAVSEAGAAGRKRAAGPRWLAGLEDAGDAMLDPVLFVHALAALAESRGVRIAERTEVRAIMPSSGGVVVRTEHGDVTCARVVVCTNPDAARLVPSALPAVRPVRAQALAAWCDPAPHWTRPVYGNRGGEYWRVLPDGRVLLGGLRRTALRAENTGVAAVNPTVQRGLDAFLRSLLAPGTRIDVTHRWSGIMGFTRDGLPVVGRVADGGDARGSARNGVYALAGFNGHGMGWAPGLATALAEELTGRTASELGGSSGEGSAGNSGDDDVPRAVRTRCRLDRFRPGRR